MQIGDLSVIHMIFFFSINKLFRFFNNPDVIVFHDIYNLRQTILIFKMIFSGKKILITPRGAFSEIALKRSFIKKRIYFYLFLYPIINKIYAFIALNKGEKKQIKSFIQNKKIIIIGNGVNDNLHIYNKFKQNYLYKEKNKVINIGYFGRFDIHIKGLDILLKAFLDFQIKYKSDKINLIFIGDHVAKSEYNSKKFIDSIRSKLLFPENLIIKGPFHSETKWEELSKIDLLIQPSRTEGMPNSVLEAMSIGIPSCVTKFTNMEEIIRNAKNGWVIELSSKSIVNFFFELNNYEKKDLIHMGVNGMQYAKKHLLWNKVSISDYK